MTTTDSIASPKLRIDWTAPVLWLFALVLVALILLPLSWLAVYSLTGAVTDIPAALNGFRRAAGPLLEPTRR